MALNEDQVNLIMRTMEGDLRSIGFNDKDWHEAQLIMSFILELFKTPCAMICEDNHLHVTILPIDDKKFWQTISTFAASMILKIDLEK